MSPHTPHARLLKLAALEVLEPLGLAQRSHSRTWLDDQTWWLILVEFQPDSVLRGTYLNVGVMWLWHEKDCFSFDVGHRIEGFTSFRHKSQFGREAARLARKAAEQVEDYRRLFSTVDAVAEYLRAHCDPRNPWDLYHAGVACGVSGRGAEAAHYLEQVAEQPLRAAREEAPQRRAMQLCNLCSDKSRFRLAVERTVCAARSALKLPPVGAVLFDDQATCD